MVMYTAWYMRTDIPQAQYGQMISGTRPQLTVAYQLTMYLQNVVITCPVRALYTCLTTEINAHFPKHVRIGMNSCFHLR